MNFIYTFLRYNITRLDTDKERIIGLKEKPEENFQSEAWSKNNTKNSESNMRYLEDIVTRPKVGIVRIEIGILEGEKERKWSKSNGGWWCSKTAERPQENLQTPRRIIKEKTIPWYIINGNEIKNNDKNYNYLVRGGKIDQFESSTN